MLKTLLNAEASGTLQQRKDQFPSGFVITRNTGAKDVTDPTVVPGATTIKEGGFVVQYLPRTPQVYQNAHFPSIKIVHPRAKYWIQVITYQTKCGRFSFIDSTPELYPVYTRKNTFSDTPSWTYNVFARRPVYTWTARAYAFDARNVCLGGFSWGYTLPRWRVLPHSLSAHFVKPYQFTKDYRTLRHCSSRVGLFPGISTASGKPNGEFDTGGNRVLERCGPHSTSKVSTDVPRVD